MAAQGSLGTGLPGTLIPAPSVLRLSSRPDLGASAPAPGKRRPRGQTGAKRRAGGASSAPCVPRLFRTPGKWAQEGLRAEAALWGPLRVQAGRGPCRGHVEALTRMSGTPRNLASGPRGVATFVPFTVVRAAGGPVAGLTAGFTAATRFSSSLTCSEDGAPGSLLLWMEG